MNYVYKKETDNLGGFVESRFSFDFQKLPSKVKDLIVPDCTPGIMYLEKGSFTRCSKWGNTVLEEGKAYLFGQKTRSVDYLFENDDISAKGLKLFPYAIHSMFGISAHEITDQFIELDVPYKTDEIVELIYEERATNKVVEFQPRLDMLKSVLMEIHTMKGLVSINDLVIKFNTSYKKLERLFKLYIGITPKLYARITRFNNSLKLGMYRKFSLTDVAYASGYFDQNHFIKEVKMFCDLPPGKVMNMGESRIQCDHLDYILNRTF